MIFHMLSVTWHTCFSGVLWNMERREEGSKGSTHSNCKGRQNEREEMERKPKSQIKKILYSDTSIENTKISAFCMSKLKYTNNRGLHVQLKLGNMKKALSQRHIHVSMNTCMHTHT